MATLEELRRQYRSGNVVASPTEQRLRSGGAHSRLPAGSVAFHVDGQSFVVSATHVRHEDIMMMVSGTGEARLDLKEGGSMSVDMPHSDEGARQAFNALSHSIMPSHNPAVVVYYVYNRRSIRVVAHVHNTLITQCRYSGDDMFVVHFRVVSSEVMPDADAG